MNRDKFLLGVGILAVLAIAFFSSGGSFFGGGVVSETVGKNQATARPARNKAALILAGKPFKEFVQPTRIKAGTPAPLIAVIPPGAPNAQIGEQSLADRGLVTQKVVGDVRFASVAKGGGLNFDTNLGGPESVAGSFIIQLSILPARISGGRIANNTALDAELKKFGGYTARSLFRSHLKSGDPLSSWIVVQLGNRNIPNEVVVARIKKISGVKSISPNYLAKTSQVMTGTAAPSQSAPPPVIKPNDPLFSQQYMHTKIDSLKAWNETQGGNTVVAVIDTGVDWAHEDLAQNIWQNLNEIPGNGVDDDQNGFVDDAIGWDFVDTTPWSQYPLEDYLAEDNDPGDYFGHGTHVAGIIGAILNNNKGVVGVCPGCKIMALRAGYTPGYLEYADIVQALVYAADNGAKVVNMSFGGGYDDPSMKAAIDYAFQRGVTLVAAAGNWSADTGLYGFYPANYQNVISVGATDSNDMKAGFSNYGLRVDVAAPGVDILSTVPSYAYYLSSYCPPIGSGQNYGNCSGTSMAAPIVAGIAGLTIGSTGKTLTPQTVQSVIESAAQTFGQDIQTIPKVFIGTGRVYAPPAIQFARDFPNIIAQMSDLSLVGTDGKVAGDLPVFGSASGVGVTSASLEISANLYQYLPLTGYTQSINIPVSNNSLATLRTGDLQNGPYMVRLLLKDAQGETIARSQKLISLENVKITDPIAGFYVVNPKNISPTKPIQFIGTIAGNFIKYRFLYRLNGSGNFSSSGFTYNNNTAQKFNELVASFIPPTPFVGAGFFEVQIELTYPLFSLNYTFSPYKYDDTIRAGFPVVVQPHFESFAIPFPTLAPLDINGDGKQELAAAIYSSDIQTFQREAQIFVYDRNGNLLPQWPVSLPQSLVANGRTYSLSWIGGQTVTVADINNDGKDDVLVHANYSDYNGGGTLDPSQSVIFAFRDGGILIPGFPIVTSYQKDDGSGVLDSTQLLAADLDRDGKNEFVFKTGDYIGDYSGTKKFFSHVGIAKLNSQNQYEIASYTITHATYPSPAPGICVWLFFEGGPLAAMNVDSDPRLEIALPTASLGVFQSQFSTCSGSSFLSVFKDDGVIVPGWPHLFGDALTGGVGNAEGALRVALGNIMGQSFVGAQSEFANNLMGIGYSKFYLFDHDGNQAQGWPISLSSGKVDVDNLPVFADITGDSVSEIIFPEREGIHAFSQNGIQIYSLPTAAPSSFIGLSPLVVDQGGNAVVGAITGAPFLWPPTSLEFRGYGQDTNLLFTKAMSGYYAQSPTAVDFDNNSLSNFAAISREFINPNVANFDQRYLIYIWDSPTIDGIDWPMPSYNNQRINANLGLGCHSVVNGEIITQSTTLCAGTYNLQNGITVRANSSAPIKIDCQNQSVELLGTGGNGKTGITIDAAADGQGSVEVNGCVIRNYTYGIKVNKTVNFALTNNIIDQVNWGILMQLQSFLAGSFQGLITGNQITGAGNLTNATGIVINKYANTVISQNTIHVGKDGIVLDQADNTVIHDNVSIYTSPPFYGSGAGIKITNSQNGAVYQNVVFGFWINLVAGTNTHGWKFYRNDVSITHTGQSNASETQGSLNTWYDAQAQQGNYWSNHVCIDNAPPFGICENPYPIYPTNSQDLYPLKFPLHG